MLGKILISHYRSQILLKLKCVKFKGFEFQSKKSHRNYCDFSAFENFESSSKMELVEDPNIVIDKQPHTPVSEGLANVDFPSTLDVFYNPVQEFNRDMSIAVLRLHASDFSTVHKAKNSCEKNADKKKIFALNQNDFEMVSTNTEILPCGVKDNEGIRILEALAASGLRSIRYAKEVGGISEIIANDISRRAIECMKNNLKSNGVEDIVKPSENDASLVMYQNREFGKQFTAIDLDPYGSPHTFLDGAVQSVVDGGLLLVTCTDMAVLCGNSPETCYLKYGALSMKHNACHEMALRIVLQCIEANANKFGRYIVPLLSVSVDFYCRIFVRVFTSQLKCKETFSKVSWVHMCSTCASTIFQPLGHIARNGKSVKYQLSTLQVGPTCTHCGGTYRTGGPIWTAPIHDPNFVSRLKASLLKGPPLNTHRRLEGILSMVEEELPDVPLYLVFDKMLKVLRMPCFKMKEFSSAILNAGYRVSPTHAARNGLKTDAPYMVLWNILRARERLHPINRERLPDNHPARVILKHDGNTSQVSASDSPEFGVNSVNFEIHPDATFESVKAKVLRFQVNPQCFWGPKTRSVTSLFHGDLQKKSKKNQGTKKNKKLRLDHDTTETVTGKAMNENEEPISLT